VIPLFQWRLAGKEMRGPIYWQFLLPTVKNVTFAFVAPDYTFAWHGHLGHIHSYTAFLLFPFFDQTIYRHESSKLHTQTLLYILFRVHTMPNAKSNCKAYGTHALRLTKNLVVYNKIKIMQEQTLSAAYQCHLKFS